MCDSGQTLVCLIILGDLFVLNHINICLSSCIRILVMTVTLADYGICSINRPVIQSMLHYYFSGCSICLPVTLPVLQYYSSSFHCSFESGCSICLPVTLPVLHYYLSSRHFVWGVVVRSAAQLPYHYYHLFYYRLLRSIFLLISDE